MGKVLCLLSRHTVVLFLIPSVLALHQRFPPPQLNPPPRLNPEQVSLKNRLFCTTIILGDLLNNPKFVNVFCLFLKNYIYLESSVLYDDVE